KREAIAYLQGAAICHAVKPEPEKPAQAQAIPCNSDRKELISSSLQYLTGITDDLTDWTLWKQIENGREHRFAKDAAGVIQWEIWYAMRKVIIPPLS
ncbi:MAG: hypothetical protein AB1611_14610, partial [bacterium]